jgi:macrolide-specific efflux system membrane fusion protein
VTRRDFASTVLATGAVKPQVGAEVRVGSRISGQVERLHANIGDRVKTGQVIAELQKADLEATVRQRKAELAEASKRLNAERREGPLKIQHAQAQLEEAEAERTIAQTTLHAVDRERQVQLEEAQAEVARWSATSELTRKELARQKTLSAKGVASQDALDRAEERHTTVAAQLKVAQKKLDLAAVQQEEDLKKAGAALAKAKTACSVAERALALEQAEHEERLEQLEAAVARAQAALDHARVQLSYATITAPIAGVIGAVTTQEGETVAAGLNAPTFVTIIDLDRLQVDAFVDEVDIGKVERGQKATFTVDAFPGREFEGKVAAIYPKAVLQENVVYYDTEIRITSPYAGLLRPEMTANVTLFLEARADVLAIPAKAIQRQRGKNVVYVVTNGQPAPREIQAGWRDGSWVEVAAGLEEGETVLLQSPKPNTNKREAGP